ncbi:Hpt domain-containing protein, partial [Photobacterium sp. ZSDE20]|nr:Hpt domain-containing protein [Photobacterium sp. ZSDE20]
VLNRFCQGAPEIMTETFDNLTQLEWVTLERNLHTLKSMAASIGGLRLAELLSDLESKAHNKACDEQDLKQGNSGLAELIQAVESEFEAPCTEEAEISLGNSSDSSSLTSEQRNKLLSLLDAYDNDATQYVSELLVEYPHLGVLKEVRSALENYDFERANEVLNASE